jgi:hypothetical protein
MEIAKKIYSSDYLKLNLNELDSHDWEKAIKIFEKRLFERFVEPIDKLIEFESDLKPIDKKYGFTILAIDCMILETLQSFYEGKLDTNGKSEKVFKRFLTQRDNFKKHFNNNTASIFFKDFRCGILHQLETYQKAKVWSIGELLYFNDNIMIINRNEFHECIKKEIDIYIGKLKNEDELKENFKNKMDFICTR